MTPPPDSPIFVVGFQRSGTTLLQALLGAHPAIGAPPELHYFSRVADLADFFGDLADDANLRRALHEALNPPVPLLAECGFDEQVLFERARAGPRTYAALLDVIMSDFAARHGKRRWCEKTPTQPASSVFSHFPDAQVVHIVRDPRDVVASSMEMPWTGMNARQVASAWRAFTHDNVRVGLEAGPARFVQVRYEDLARDPASTLGVICAFLGEAMAPEMLDDPTRRSATVAPAAARWHGTVFERRPPPSPGGFRERMGRVDRARVAATVAATLPAFGYEPPRRATVAAGHALNALLAPGELPALAKRLRVRAVARTPEARYRELQRFARERAASVTPPSPVP
jgi:hypothetical protein